MSNRLRAVRKRLGPQSKPPKLPGAPAVFGDFVLDDQFILREVLARIRNRRDPDITKRLEDMSPEDREALCPELVASERERRFQRVLRELKNQGNETEDCQ